ncbi:hypothetical protein MXB_4988 [Myxobolus squamalis]|nr:hypothetical protein MXB_4988 [Myxobolus squamalis]
MQLFNLIQTDFSRHQQIWNVKKFISTLNEEICVKYKQTMKVCVPSFLYVIQNNLLLVAIKNLPAVVFQILTTALMSVIMLNRHLNRKQWFALVILFTGVVLVNWKPETKSESKELNASADSAISTTFVGLSAVVLCCLTSAFSGVYFELLLKKEKSDIIIANIQLSLSGVVLSVLTGIFLNYNIILEKGFFVGFNKYVWIYIFTQAIGGLVVAVVVKYADNILKGFATSVAIILSAILSYFLFSFSITFLFTLGASLVISSVLIYSYA